MRIKHFEKKIKHLTQLELVSGAVSVLCKVLVRKGHVSTFELQSGLLEWMKENRLESKKIPSLKELSLKELADLEDKHTAMMGHCSYSIPKVSKKKKSKK